MIAAKDELSLSLSDEVNFPYGIYLKPNQTTKIDHLLRAADQLGPGSSVLGPKKTRISLRLPDRVQDLERQYHCSKTPS